jgi:hypothetical protein
MTAHPTTTAPTTMTQGRRRRRTYLCMTQTNRDNEDDTGDDNDDNEDDNDALFTFFEPGLVKSMALTDSEPSSLKKGLPAVVRLQEQVNGGAHV